MGRPKKENVEPKAKLRMDIPMQTKELLRNLQTPIAPTDTAVIIQLIHSEAERRGIKPKPPAKAK